MPFSSGSIKKARPFGNDGKRFNKNGRDIILPQVVYNGSGRKAPGGTHWFNDKPRTKESLGSMGGKSKARKAASAMIAKIPLPLSRHIAAVYRTVP